MILRLVVKLDVTPSDVPSVIVRNNMHALIEQACDGAFDLADGDGDVSLVSVETMED